jgi:Flp pilus assembly protein TadD
MNDVGSEQTADLPAMRSAAATLRDQGRLEEACEILVDAAANFPNDVSPWHDLGRLAEAQQEWSLAEGCWRRYLALDDTHWRVHTALAAVLQRQDRGDEAEAVLRAATTLFSSEFGPWHDLAHLEQSRQRWAEAEACWRQAMALGERAWWAYTGLATALRQQDRGDEARAVLQTVITLFPNETRPWHDLARLEEARRNWPGAEACWRRYLALDDTHWRVHEGLAATLAEQERYLEAEAALQRAIELSAPNPGPVIAYAELAERRQDWAAAAHRWLETSRLFPSEPYVVERIFIARARLIATDEQSDAAAEAILPLGPLDPRYAGALRKETEDGTAFSDIMMACESLGGTALGCEFGGVQRAFGAEPLSLLRWTEMDPDQIIAALEARFDGVGTPEQTEVDLSDSDGHNEYWTRDKRFGMASHTFVHESAVSHEKMFRQSTRRLAYLKNKLIDDLIAGDKIFVYKISQRMLSDKELDAMYRAMQAYGRNALLYVTYSSFEHPNGSVEEREAGLFIGYTDRFVVSRDGKLLQDDDAVAEVIKTWAQICAVTYARWRETRAALIE